MSDSFPFLIAGGIVLYLAVVATRRYRDPGKPDDVFSKQVCKDCGHIGSSKQVIKGSIIFEIILWLCFIVPGLIYTIWRLSTKRQACPECGGSMIPVNSPIGRKIAGV